MYDTAQQTVSLYTTVILPLLACARLNLTLVCSCYKVIYNVQHDKASRNATYPKNVFATKTIVSQDYNMMKESGRFNKNSSK